ncbi:hypothetical protein ACFOMD_17440 [Sphingoaurantiacus capsulatus]|uniref:Uncharacterized protein n=1 Tax=Sphingoaurantiacus capsulatus TaxID=1771310 RepID=A0ABV7XEY2_9SPHN
MDDVLPALSARFCDVVSTPASVMGVKAVFGPLSSHMICFGGRGERGSSAYYAVAKGAAKKAAEKPYAIFIGGGSGVRGDLGGRVLNFARVSALFGDTATFVSDAEAARLAQWPVAVALHDVWSFEGAPHLISDLGFSDRKILAGAQDGIIRPEGKVEALWEAHGCRPRG